MTGAASISITIDSLPQAIAVLDAAGTVIEANPPLVRLLGGDPCGEQFVGLVGDDDRDRMREGLARREHDHTLRVTFEAFSPLGATVQIASVIGSDLVLATVAEADDIGSIGEIGSEAHDLLGQGVLVGDGNRILHVTNGAAQLFGRSVEELLDIGSIFHLFEPSEQRRLATLVAECVESGTPMPERLRTAIVRADDEVLPVDLWIKATVKNGRTRTYSIIADAAELARMEAELARRATHDHLTGLPNRFLLLDRLESMLRRFQRTTPFVGAATLSYIDLDGFKAVNDTFGHLAGDHVLRITAERLLASARDTDTVARLGGDEFVVLSDPMSSIEGDAMARRLEPVLNRPITYQAAEIRVRASIGCCQFADGSLDADGVLNRADRSMYAVKRERRSVRA